MFRLTRRLWLTTAFGHVAAGMQGCGGGRDAGPESSDGGSGAGGDSGGIGAAVRVGSYVLEELPGKPMSPGYAAGINASGAVAGQFTTSDRRSHACVWQETRLHDLDRADGSWSGARAVNARGHVVGELQTEAGGRLRAFLWTGESTIILDGLGGRESHALGINESGLVAGHATDRDGLFHALLWEERKAVPLPPLGGEFAQSQAVAVNAQGMVVGASFHGQAVQAVAWRDRKVEVLGALEGGKSSIATAVNRAGVAVGCSQLSSEPGRHACRWENQTVRDLHDLGVSSSAAGINRAGLVVGFYTTRQGEDRAFLHDGGKMHDLTRLLTGVRRIVLRYAMAIDDRGWIVGLCDRAGHPAPFVARPA